MKKIFTILFSVAIGLAAVAQKGARYAIVPGIDNTFLNTYKEYKSISYAATVTLAPTQEATVYDFATLTGAMTINATLTPCYTGDRMTCMFIANGSDRVVTFNTGFTANGTLNVVASTRSIIQFVFNSSKWIEVSRNSNGGSNTLLAADGTVAAPGFAFASDPDVGLYRIGANNAGIGVNGAKVLDIGTSGLGVTGTTTSSGVFLAPVGAVSAPAYSITGHTNFGMYYVSSTQLGFSVNGGLQGGFNSSGLFTNYITEQNSGQGINAVNPIVHSGVVTTYTTTANVTAAAIGKGIIAYTGSAHTLTLPSTAAIAGVIGASTQGTYFDFVLDNTGGSGTVTLALDASMTAASAVTGGTTLTLAQSTTVGQAGFRITFISGTVSIISRLY